MAITNRKEVFETLLKRVNEGTAILMVSIEKFEPIPTIHNFYPEKYYSSINHLGFGVFKGSTEHGDFTFCGGGAMEHHNFGENDWIAWTSLDGSPEVLKDLGYDFEAVKGKLKQLIEGE
jgi:hypothetical protein